MSQKLRLKIVFHRFLEEHINTKTLSDKDRSFLVTQSCIFLSSIVGYKPTPDQKLQLASTIKSVFSTDTQTDALIQHLESKFSKLKNVMPISGIPTYSRKRKAENTDEETTQKPEIESIFFHQEDFDVLENVETRELVEFCLKRTAKVRKSLYEQKSLKIFDFYFKDYSFINFDFNAMFPQATSFFQYWDLISKAIDDFYTMKAVIKSTEIDEWSPEVAHFLKLLDLLPASSVNRSKNPMVPVKVESAFEKFIKFGYCDFSPDKVPYIIAYGADKKHIDRFVIHLNDKYIEFGEGVEFKTVVDILCKIYHIFQIKWDHSLSVFYSFFSTKVYGITRRITSRITEIFGNLTVSFLFVLLVVIVSLLSK